MLSQELRPTRFSMSAVEKLGEHTSGSTTITFARQLTESGWSYFVLLNGYACKPMPPVFTRSEGKAWYTTVVNLFP